MQRPAISSRTQLCAVIGNPVGHSLSPAIHNAAFAALGLDFVYLAFRVDDLPAALAGVRALENFRGLSVTIPHKLAAMAWVDEVAEVDRSIGSINTVIKEEGRLVGFGTDGPGALQALLAAGVGVDDKHVLLLGAGGAARAIAFTLATATRVRALSLVDMAESVLQGLAGDLRARTAVAVDAAVSSDVVLAERMAQADIIINCTPVGMHPHVEATPIPAALFRPGQVAFDIVYTPLETRFLADARARGLVTVSGVEMFINQAVLQFKAFTGREAPVEVMRRVVLETLTL
jgi:shikimate dehydrogenase